MNSRYVYLPDARQYLNPAYLVELILPQAGESGWVRLVGEKHGTELTETDVRVLAQTLSARTLNHPDVPLDEFHCHYPPRGARW